MVCYVWFDEVGIQSHEQPNWGKVSPIVKYQRHFSAQFTATASETESELYSLPVSGCKQTSLNHICS